MNSWCEMDDELDDNKDHLKKEILHPSSMIDSIGFNNSNRVGIKFKQDDEQLSIGEILELDCQKISEIKLLKYQTYVIQQLKKHTNQCKEEEKTFDIKMHINKLNWLLQTTTTLARNRNQRDVKLKKKDFSSKYNNIQRNSYEFCNNYRCDFNKSGKCNRKHLVYNYLKYDINELIQYLLSNDEKCIKEISITVNTINYVLNHMYDELTTNANNTCSKIS